DPEGQGRVQVRFDWQTNDTTHFIRMMSPDAGGTDQITQNRGYVAIPEVGDQVMVNFVHNHPDRPFVMGGMFHGGIGLGGGMNNRVKSIQTRSGIRILMNDEEGSVKILDPSGNSIFMDGKGNISMNAPKNFTLNAGDNINITAGKEISIDAGASITSSANDNIISTAGTDIVQTASGDIRETSDTRSEMVEKEFFRQSETSNEIAGEISMFSELENMTMQSGKIVEFNSAEKSKLF
ncbi:MAG: Vgr family protein, partial [Chryseobacterium sp.]|uniref:phage baseplate assembly protein V n=1 Tax=Chryseobacterium sp. TaxID=1871047 RepID=UPI002603DDC5